MTPFIVTLFNFSDEALMKRRELASSKVRSCEVEASVDMKNAWTVIPRSVAGRLGVEVRTYYVGKPDGRKGTLILTVPIRIKLLGRDTIEEVKVGGGFVKLGFTTLAKLDLVVDTKNDRVISNPAHPNGPGARV